MNFTSQNFQSASSAYLQFEVSDVDAKDNFTDFHLLSVKPALSNETNYATKLTADQFTPSEDPYSISPVNDRQGNTQYCLSTLNDDGIPQFTGTFLDKNLGRDIIAKSGQDATSFVMGTVIKCSMNNNVATGLNEASMYDEGASSTWGGTGIETPSRTVTPIPEVVEDLAQGCANVKMIYDASRGRNDNGNTIRVLSLSPGPEPLSTFGGEKESIAVLNRELRGKDIRVRPLLNTLQDRWVFELASDWKCNRKRKNVSASNFQAGHQEGKSRYNYEINPEFKDQLESGTGTDKEAIGDLIFAERRNGPNYS